MGLVKYCRVLDTQKAAILKVSNFMATTLINFGQVVNQASSLHQLVLAHLQATMAK